MCLCTFEHFHFVYRAFVFFSSPIAKELVDHIKKDTTVLSRIGGLREVTVSYLFIYLFISSSINFVG